MADSLIVDFRTSFPELDEKVTDQGIKNADRVARELVHGTQEQLLWATAHLSVVQDTDLIGDVKSMTIGGITKSFMTISKRNRDVFWATTHYGRVYLTLVRQTPATVGLKAIY